MRLLCVVVPWIGVVQFVELDERADGNAMRYELSKMTGRTSVPQIWIAGEYVGGCNDGEWASRT